MVVLDYLLCTKTLAYCLFGLLALGLDCYVEACVGWWLYLVINSCMLTVVVGIYVLSCLFIEFCGFCMLAVSGFDYLIFVSKV